MLTQGDDDGGVYLSTTMLTSGRTLDMSVWSELILLTMITL